MRITRHQLRQIIREQLIRERMGTDVYKIVVQTLDKQGPKTHQQLLATILDDFPNTSDDELDEYIDGFEESGDIIFDPATQTYHQGRKMRITRKQLRRIIKEVGLPPDGQTIADELIAANLTPAEMEWVESEWHGEQDLYGNEVVFDKLFNYYMDIDEMPYEVAKARTATPDEWIIDRWDELEAAGMGF